VHSNFAIEESGLFFLGEGFRFCSVADLDLGLLWTSSSRLESSSLLERPFDLVSFLTSPPMAILTSPWGKTKTSQKQHQRAYHSAIIISSLCHSSPPHGKTGRIRSQIAVLRCIYPSNKTGCLCTTRSCGDLVWRGAGFF
jgi:hypothetical protein